MRHHHRSNRFSTAVFLIGLALLMLTGWWFPGILFVIGASLMAGAIDQGRPWHSATPAFVCFAIGVVFGLPGILQGINWTAVIVLLLVAIALSTLFSRKPEPPTDEYDYYDDDSDSGDDDDDDSEYV